MKKYLIALTLFVAVAVAFADVWVYQSDGTRYSHNYSTFDSLSRVTPGTLALSQSERIVPCEGETFNLDIYAGQSWTASVSDASRIQLSKTHGNGNDVISVNVAANKLDTQVYDTITVKLADGTQNAIHLIGEAWQDDLTVNPLSQKFTPAGGTFKVGVTSNTSWTVDNNADWVSLDKASGMLNDSITVKVSPSDTEKTTQSILTVTTPNKATLHSVVTRIGDEISVSPSSKTFSPIGGSYKIYVSSNTSWTVSASEPWVIFDKLSGTLNDSIVVNVAKSDNVETTTAIITVTTLNGKTTQSKIIREGDAVSVGPLSKTFAPAGGTYKIGVQSNTSWVVSASKPWVTFDKTNGTLNDSVVVYVDESGDANETTATIKVNTDEGRVAKCKVNMVKEQLSVSDSIKIIGYNGGFFNITINSNNYWSASSDKSWAVLSNTSGVGNDTITIYVEENTGVFRDTALITFTAHNGTQDMIVVGRTTIGKCKASDYAWVTIGTQIWMAEDYKCSKYDTESEAYNASWLTDNTVPDAFYFDATDKTRRAFDNLSNEQIAKLGYLYNWAAAVGVENGESQTSAFTGNRQGICPNGWHVPTRAEWQTLYDYIYNDQKLSTNTVGKYLKATTGWQCNGSSRYGYNDGYGFAALLPGSLYVPGGYSYPIIINGYYAYFWTATPIVVTTIRGCGESLDFGSSSPSSQRSVRCLKD